MVVRNLIEFSGIVGLWIAFLEILHLGLPPGYSVPLLILMSLSKTSFFGFARRTSGNWLRRRDATWLIIVSCC